MVVVGGLPEPAFIQSPDGIHPEPRRHYSGAKTALLRLPAGIHPRKPTGLLFQTHRPTPKFIPAYSLKLTGILRNFHQTTPKFLPAYSSTKRHSSSSQPALLRVPNGITLKPSRHYSGAQPALLRCPDGITPAPSRHYSSKPHRRTPKVIPPYSEIYTGILLN